MRLLRLLAPLGHQRAEPDLALEKLLDGLGDAPGAAQLVLVVLELAGKQEGVERETVARRRDVRTRDVGAGGRTGAGKQRQQARMVGRQQRQLGDGRERVGGEVAGELAARRARRRGRAWRARRPCAVSVLQPVVGIVPLDEALDLLLRPIGSAARKASCAAATRSRGAELGVPAGNQRLGLVVERAQQLALPAVPDAGTDRADVGDGQHQQQLQPLRALHDVGEVADRSWGRRCRG